MLPIPEYLNVSQFEVEECPQGYYRTFKRVIPIFLYIVWLDLYIEDRKPDEEDGTEGKYKVHIDIYLGTKWFRVKTYRFPSFRISWLSYFCNEKSGDYIYGCK